MTFISLFSLSLTPAINAIFLMMEAGKNLLNLLKFVTFRAAENRYLRLEIFWRCRYENLTIYLCSCKNGILQISHYNTFPFIKYLYHISLKKNVYIFWIIILQLLFVSLVLCLHGSTHNSWTLHSMNFIFQGIFFRHSIVS